MKQNITIEQLNELSDKGKEKLREWWKPKEGDLTDCGTYYYDGEYVFFENKMDGNQKCYPLLSIGQMIEFLDDNKMIMDIDPHYQIGYLHGEKFIVGGKTICWWDKELCDVLWLAIKKVLEK